MNLLFRRAGVAATGWMIMATILFCLPGSAIPAAGWMSTLQVDKWVHVGIFFLLFMLWRSALRVRLGKHVALLSSAVIGYGCLIEVVQHNYIENRSFDGFDIAADAAGTLAGWVYWQYTKK